jgi:hypothetical protein
MQRMVSNLPDRCFEAEQQIGIWEPGKKCHWMTAARAQVKEGGAEGR